MVSLVGTGNLNHGRRPGAEFGGTQKNFRGLFRKKFPFSRRRILMTFFLVIDQGFRVLTLFRFSVSLLYQMSYMTLSSQQKTPFQQKNSLTTPTFYSLQFLRPSHNTTFQNIQLYFSKYWGRGPMHGPSPHLKFWVGPSPPVPP